MIRLMLALMLFAMLFTALAMAQEARTPIVMTDQQIAAADYDTLVSYLKSHGWGERLFRRGKLPLDYVRETARCLGYQERQEACPPTN